MQMRARPTSGHTSLPAWPIVLFILAMACLTTTKLFALERDITTSGGWVRETPPGTRNAAAFITLNNHSSTIKQVVGVQCQATVAARCEMHEHITIDGRMRMQKVNSIDIPPTGKVQFAPGGFHIMLINIATPLKAGSTIELVFTFADQSTYLAQLPVKAISQE
jgi:copper(I)-binding protein